MIGMTYKSVDDSVIRMTQLMLPSYSNFRGKIHGGYILNLMDQVAFACAARHSGQYCVTASVDRVDFLNSIEVGELVTLIASVNFTGRTSMVVGLRVESENVQTGEVKHCNSSYFTMVAKDDSGNNVPVPGLILKTEDEVRRFARSISTREQSRLRDLKYDSSEFVIDQYLEQVEGHNAVVDLKKG